MKKISPGAVLLLLVTSLFIIESNAGEDKAEDDKNKKPQDVSPANSKGSTSKMTNDSPTVSVSNLGTSSASSVEVEENVSSVTTVTETSHAPTSTTRRVNMLEIATFVSLGRFEE